MYLAPVVANEALPQVPIARLAALGDRPTELLEVIPTNRGDDGAGVIFQREVEEERVVLFELAAALDHVAVFVQVTQILLQQLADEDVGSVAGNVADLTDGAGLDAMRLRVGVPIAEAPVRFKQVVERRDRGGEFLGQPWGHWFTAGALRDDL